MRISLTCLLILPAGCGKAGVKFVSDAFPPVWIGHGDSGVIMLQVTRNGDDLTGSLDLTGLLTPVATQVTPVHASFTGTVADSSITLTFAQGLGFSSSISGSLSGNTMVLNLPTDSGQIASITLRPGTVEDYNRLVADLTDTATANAKQSAQAAASAEVAAAQQRLREEIDDAAASVRSDLSNLESAESAVDFSGFEDAIQRASDDLNAAQTDAGKAASEASRADACYDASNAEYDASNVEYESSNVDYEVSNVNYQIGVVNSAAETLRSDLDTYQRLTAELPGYASPRKPDLGAAQTALDAVPGLIADWQAKATGYQSQVAELVTQAYAVADQAQQAYC